VTLTPTTDYWLWPDNPWQNKPYERIDLNPNSNTLISWPNGRRRVKVDGLWGYSNETESVGTLGAAITDTTGTSVTMAGGHTVSAGDTLEIDSEHFYVSAVASNTLTVTRGQNGTTAATHNNAAAVVRRRFDRLIERAVLMQTARFYRDTIAGYSGSVANAADGGYPFTSLYPAIRDLLNERRVPVLG
jgi:hypothetical protein